MLNYRRGPEDDIWGATFWIDGKWQPKDGVSLGTRDFDDAAEIAREKYTLLTNGHKIVTPRAPKAAEHAVLIYAKRAIDKLLEQAKQEDAKVKGKGHNYRTQTGRIEDLLPRWGATDIRTIDEHSLNDWVRDGYRVEDRAATVKKYGQQSRGEGRQIIYKMPAATSLGNLDWALSLVWEEAASDHVVDRRRRPVIDKSLGEDTEPRAFIDEAGVRACMKVMTDDWVNTASGHGTAIKRLLRCYVSLIGSTGIRAGLEAMRIRLCDVQFKDQHGKPVIIVRVWRNQGKHKNARTVVVYEGNPYLRVRHLLRDLIAYREAQHAKKTDYLFSYENNTWPSFRRVMDTLLREGDAKIDPITGEKRVPYSFRHFFATDQIARSSPIISVAQLAEWMGTSSAMIEKHYNRFLVERNAHLLNGAPDEPLDYVDEEGPWHWEGEGEQGAWVPG
jgi:integrase